MSYLSRLTALDRSSCVRAGQRACHHRSSCAPTLPSAEDPLSKSLSRRGSPLVGLALSAGLTPDGLGLAPVGLVFTHEDGRAFNPISLKWAYEVALREWGGRKIRFHDTRHTHAAILIAAGVHPKVIQERLGHANISTTLQVYGHLFPESDVDAATKAAALISGPML